MKKYALSAPARADLDGIREYLAPAPPPIQARILSAFRDTFRELAEFPGIGRLEPELTVKSATPVRSLRVFAYRIFYYPERNPVIILAILHGARDIRSLLMERAESSKRPPSDPLS